MPKSKLSQTEYENAYKKALQQDVPKFLLEMQDLVWAKNHSADKEKAHNAFIAKLKDMILDYTKERNSIQDFSPKRNALIDTKIADEPFFLYFIKTAPELADFFTWHFYDNYDYLRDSEVIKYLAMPVINGARCATSNVGRRAEIISGKEPFPLRVPYYDKTGKKVDNFTDQELAMIREKLILREKVLTPVANHFSKRYLCKKIINGEDINARTVISLQNIIKDYPDILAMYYNSQNNNVFASYLLDFPYRNPLDLLPAFANKNGLDNEGYPASVNSKYTVSPEEILWYGINTDNKNFVKRFVIATADIFSTENRINEHIENIAKIIVFHPDYISEVVGLFIRKTSYQTSKYPSKILIARYFQNTANETKNPVVIKEMAKALSQAIGRQPPYTGQCDYDLNKTGIINNLRYRYR